DACGDGTVERHVVLGADGGAGAELDVGRTAPATVAGARRPDGVRARVPIPEVATADARLEREVAELPRDGHGQRRRGDVARELAVERDRDGSARRRAQLELRGQDEETCVGQREV